MKSQQKEKDQSPYKKALSKRLSLNLAPSFPPTKNAKKGFASNPPKREFKKESSKKESLKIKRSNPQKRGFKKKDFKKRL